MAELDDLRDDDMMTALFADVREEAAGYIRPAGAAAAAVTVRRRHRNRTIAAAALAVALVVGPAIGIAWAQNRPDGPPEVADPTPSVSATGSPSQTPSAAPTASTGASLLDPGIPADQLRNATLSVPQWPGSVNDSCPNGQVKFTNGTSAKRAGPSGDVLLQLAGDPVYVDVDGDARLETVIRVECPLQGIFDQVVAYSRGADAKISTLGRVVASDVPGSDIGTIWKIEAGGTATVRVDVGDYHACCGVSGDYPQHQWRAYGWDGQRFKQTGGQTSFPPNPKKADLGVSAPAMQVSSAGGDSWTGTLTVTVTNMGPGTAVAPKVDLFFPVLVTLTGTDAETCVNNTGGRFRCVLRPIAPGASVQLRLTVTTAGDPHGGKISVGVVNSDANGNEYIDGNGRNDTVDVQIATR